MHIGHSTIENNEKNNSNFSPPLDFFSEEEKPNQDLFISGEKIQICWKNETELGLRDFLGIKEREKKYWTVFFSHGP